MDDPARAHLRQGSLLHDQGRLEEAAAAYRQALVLAPDHAEANNNLGSALLDLGEFAGAAASFHRAVAANPGSPFFHYNLGTALQALAQRPEAIGAYERALALKPDFVEAHYNRANLLKDEGRREDAIVAYGRAIALRPQFAEAHNNLGWTLAAAGRPEAAFESYQRALSLAPHLVATHVNLAALLEGAARFEEAAAWYANALAMEERPEYRARFAQCIRHAMFTRSNPGLKRLVARALSEAWARPADLAPAAIRMLTHDPGLTAALRDDPLLVALLESAPVTDVALEQFLTRERRALLDAALATDAQDAREPVPFHYALATQCFVNEHVFVRAPDEETHADALRERLEAALEAGTGVPALWLLAVAAYEPLSGLRTVSRLEPHMRTEPLHALWRQSVAEPLAEQVLRESMPRLTAIGAGVSGAVRAQYEANPYPRWVRLPPAPAPVTLEAFLRERFPRASPGGSRTGTGVDILVAGCGTGREPIELARQFAGARVLAIDLSKASLAYAQRKARELGVSNIEHAQGDILALDAVERTFDLVSSVGVLHHLEDPAAGLRAITSRLRPGGVVVLGLYSEAGRRAVVAGRRFIAERGDAPTPEGIRRCREALMALPEGSPLRDIAAFVDFYTTSECRDLLFHVQEHRFTLPQVKTLLAGAGLEFCGFVLDPPVLARFAEHFPEEAAVLDLDRWATFEAAHPAAFAGMYVFVARKP